MYGKLLGNQAPGQFLRGGGAFKPLPPIATPCPILSQGFFCLALGVVWNRRGAGREESAWGPVWPLQLQAWASRGGGLPRRYGDRPSLLPLSCRPRAGGGREPGLPSFKDAAPGQERGGGHAIPGPLPG